jgi:RsmE family RNA methyltransferase
MYFYLPQIPSKSLSGEASEHMWSMRVQVGDKLEVSDLQGTHGQIIITKTDKKTRVITFDFLSHTPKKPHQIKRVLFQALTDKNYLEKLVELLPHAQIDILYLFKSERTPAGSYSPDRLQKILLRSCEQSQTLWLPQIIELNQTQLQEKLTTYKPYILDTHKPGEPKIHQDSITSCLVGPEGGWSPQELQNFENLNLKYSDLGTTVYPAWLAGYSWFHIQKN